MTSASDQDARVRSSPPTGISQPLLELRERVFDEWQPTFTLDIPVDARPFVNAPTLPQQ